MANTDIRNPIVINATTSTLIASGDFLRSVCFVSLGWSNITKNTFKQIDSSEVNDILNGNNTELEKRLNSFFSYASNKLCSIVELGAQDIISASDTYENLFAYLATLGATDAEYNAFLYTSIWEASATATENAIFAKFITQRGQDTDYQTWLTQNNKTDSLAVKKEFGATMTGYPQVYYSYLADNEATFQALKIKTNLEKFADSIADKGYSKSSYEAYLRTIGTYDSDFSEKVNALADLIVDSNEQHYVYALPSGFYNDASTAALTNKYVGTNSKQYFALEIPSDWETNNKLSLYEGQKSVWAFYNNVANSSVSVLGAVLGKFASSSFDISSSLKASPINYKLLSGFSYTELINSQQRTLINSNVTYISSKANNTLIMNGRTMDSRPIDYWYQWDLTAFNIEQAITQLILNGVNNPNYAIRYNQDGIDTISASIVARLNTMINFGCVTEFGATYNSATDELTNIGYIYATDYYTYIAAEPENYQNEIYGGISFYIRIGRYIRQVVLNVTLN